MPTCQVPPQHSTAQATKHVHLQVFGFVVICIGIGVYFTAAAGGVGQLLPMSLTQLQIQPMAAYILACSAQRLAQASKHPAQPCNYSKPSLPCTTQASP